MKITITGIKTIPQNITIKTSEYYTLKHKAEAYDKQKAKRSETMKRTNNKLTQTQRTESARKAAQARWNNYIKGTRADSKRLQNKTVKDVIG